jgi:uncharacterized membrane protein YeaQ/YmgE (transglycosylase-associated protein family)
MTILELVLLLVIAGVCGAAGQAIVGLSRGGCLASIGFGFVGALLGAWISRLTGLPELWTIALGGVQFPIIWAIVGSVIFVAIVAAITRSRTRSPRGRLFS